jgi:DNA polymerase elongation subunit (family B)
MMVESIMDSKCSSHDLNSYSSENLVVLDNGYEGAVVIEPKEGIYLNEPIVVFVYGSLYPSSMMHQIAIVRKISGAEIFRTIAI